MVSPGMKTSEFWIGLLLPMFINILNQVFDLGLSDASIASLQGGGGLYAIGRGAAK
jgi:hypothetical protein